MHGVVGTKEPLCVPNVVTAGTAHVWFVTRCIPGGKLAGQLTFVPYLLPCSWLAGWLGRLANQMHPPALGCAGLWQGQCAKQPTVGCKVAVASWQHTSATFLGGEVQFAMYMLCGTMWHICT